MPSLPLPERGQPLDVTYMYQIAQAINELFTQVGTSKKGYTRITTVEAGPQDIKTSESAIDAAYKEVSTSSLQSAGTSLPWFHDFRKEFKYAPIVTATGVNKNSSDSGRDLTVTINSVTTSRVEGYIKFNVGGEITAGVNIIAVGLPNQ